MRRTPEGLYTEGATEPRGGMSGVGARSTSREQDLLKLMEKSGRISKERADKEGKLFDRSAVQERKLNWTDEKWKRAKELAAEGKTSKQIGEELGMPRNSVASKFHREDFSIGKGPKYTSEQVDAVKRMQAKGASYREIANSLGLSINQVNGLYRQIRLGNY